MITEWFVWKNMKSDISRMTKACRECQKTKIGKYNRSVLQQFNVTEHRFRHVIVGLYRDVMIFGTA